MKLFSNKKRCHSGACSFFHKEGWAGFFASIRRFFFAAGARLRRFWSVKRGAALALALLLVLQIAGVNTLQWFGKSLVGMVTMAVNAVEDLPLPSRGRKAAAAPALPASEDGNNANTPAYDWYFVAGAGTQSQPYLIKTGADLKGLANIVNGSAGSVTVNGEEKSVAQDSFAGKYIKLQPDNAKKVIDLIPFSGGFYEEDGVIAILLSSMEGVNNYGGWIPIGMTQDTAFKGYFDGNGATIQNLATNAANYNTPTTVTAAGLFGYVDFSGTTGGKISNVTLHNSQVVAASSNTTSAGVLAGSLIPNKTETSVENVTATGRNPEEGWADFLVATTSKVAVATTSITGTASAPKNCQIGGLVGQVTDVGPAGDAEYMFKNCAVRSQNTLDGTVVNVSDGYAMGGLVALASQSGFSASQCTVSGNLTAKTLSGSDSNEGYIGGILGRSQLNLQENRISNCYMKGDIALSSRSGAMVGGIIGQVPKSSSTISNCHYTGLDGISAGKITSSGGNGTGGILGRTNAGATILNCSVRAQISASGDQAGGIAGMINGAGSISNCQALEGSSISGQQFVGGIAGSQKSGLIEQCTVEKAVLTGTQYLGGVVGQLNGSGTVNNGTVTQTTLIGTGTGQVGGIAGEITGSVLNSIYDASGLTETAISVTGSVSDGVGGLVGKLIGSNQIAYSAAKNVTLSVPNLAGNGIGGVVGVMQDSNSTAAVTQCFSSGRAEVTGKSGSEVGVGGIAGVNNSTRTGGVKMCASALDIHFISSGSYFPSIGGIAGKSAGNIDQSFSTGVLSITNLAGREGQKARLGGLAGKLQNGSITSSYSTNSLLIQGTSTLDTVAGISANYSYNGSLKDNYFAGTIEYTRGGSLVGSSDKAPSITNCYYDGQVSPNAFLTSYANLPDQSEFAKGTALADGTINDAYSRADAAARKTTADLQNTDISSAFTMQQGAYPKLNWTIETAASDTVRTVLETALTSLTALSTRPLLAFSGADHRAHLSAPATLLGSGSWTAEGDAQVSGSSLTCEAGKTGTLTYQETTEGWSASRTFKVMGKPAEISAGNGTADSPYEINTAEQLRAFSDYANAGGGYLGVAARQTADIDLQSLHFSPIGTREVPFCGRFLGSWGTGSEANWHTIRNLVLGDSAEGAYSSIYYGLFGYANYGVISGVRVENITSNYHAFGGVVGQSSNMLITGCQTTGTLRINVLCYPYAGGVVGAAKEKSSLRHDVLDSTVVTTGSNRISNFGGIVGQLSESSGADSVYFLGTLGNMQEVTQHASVLGGLIGQMESGTTLQKSFALGNISGWENVGGLVGNAVAGTISDSYFSGDVIGQQNVGGLVGNGNNSVALKNLWYSGQISGSANVGAVAGFAPNMDQSANCYFNRELTGEMLAYGNTSQSTAAQGLTSNELKAAAAGSLVSGAEGYYPYLEWTDFVASPQDAAYARLAAMLAAKEIYNFKENDSAFLAKSGFIAAGLSVPETGALISVDYAPKEGLEQSGDVYTPVANSGQYIYTFTATYPVLSRNGEALTIGTKVVVPPFEGSGTQADPFQIPTVPVLVQFQKFINAGAGAPGAFYKLTAAEGVEYDLSTAQAPLNTNWKPIGSEPSTAFQGNFDGNGHTVLNLKIEDAVSYEKVYNSSAGLFGNVNYGSIKDLTITNAEIDVTIPHVGFSGGALAGRVSGSTIENVSVTGTSGIRVTERGTNNTTLDNTLRDTSVGGLIGRLDNAGTLQNCAALTQYMTFSQNGTAPVDRTQNFAMGGLVGRVYADVNSVADAINVVQCVARSQMTGTVEQKPNSGTNLTANTFAGGGLLGLAQADGTEDSAYISIRESGAYGYVGQQLWQSGGLAGIVLAKNTTAIQLASCVSTVTVQSTYGTMIANTRVGGLVGYQEYGTLQGCFFGGQVSSLDNGYTGKVGGLFGGTRDVLPSDKDQEKKLPSVLETYYDSLASAAPACGTNDSAYTDSAKTTYQLARLSADSSLVLPAPLSSAAGFYPYPVFVEDSTKQPEEIKKIVQAESVPLYYVWGKQTQTNNTDGKRTAKSFSSVYVLPVGGDSVSLSGYQQAAYPQSGAALSTQELESGKMAATHNGRRIAATGTTAVDQRTDNGIQIKVTLNGTVGRTLFQFIPDVDDTGKTDTSFYLANPEGDFISGGENTFTLYNADQVQGLALLVNYGAGRDGNGHLDPGSESGTGTPNLPMSGKTFYLARDVDASGQYAARWMPIGMTTGGTNAKPFQGIFDGQNHVLANVYFSSTGSVNYMGVFGTLSGASPASPAEVRNLGITDENHRNYTIGTNALALASLVGMAGGNVKISSCFSDVSLDSTKYPTLGGLIGAVSGTNVLMENCFFTGTVGSNSTSQALRAGGLVGEVSLSGVLQIKNSYVAGYVNAGAEAAVGSVAGAVSGTLLCENVYADRQACGTETGMYAGSGTQPGGVQDLTTKELASGTLPYGLDSGTWAVLAGTGQAYPYLAGFDVTQENMFSSQKRAAIMAVALERDAHSVTQGTALSDGAAFNMVQESLYTLSDDKKVLNRIGSGETFTTVSVSNGPSSAQRQIGIYLRCWFDEEKDNTYWIHTVAELEEFSKLVAGVDVGHTHIVPTEGPVNFKGKTVKLANDIDLSSLTQFPSIGSEATPFLGTFDGQGHSLKNISIKTSQGAGSDQGLFGWIGEGAVVEQVRISGGTILADGDAAHVGVIAGRVKGAIRHCSSEDVAVTVAAPGVSAGGLAGTLESGGTVNASFNASPVSVLADVSEGSVAGGVAGTAEIGASVTGCYNMAKFAFSGTADLPAGGIAGKNSGTIQSCYNTGMLGASAESRPAVGGIVGENSGAVQSCYNAALLAKDAKPITELGSISNCFYDEQFTNRENAETYQGTGQNTRQMRALAGTLGADYDAGANAYCYPQLTVFTGGSETERIASTVSAAAIQLDGTGTVDYANFIQGETTGEVALNRDEASSGSFTSMLEGEARIFKPEVAGPVYMNVESGGYSRQVFLIQPNTVKVRYQYDFSELASQEVPRNSGSTANTWGEGIGSASDPYKITTAQDFQTFAAQVNSGKDFVGQYIELTQDVDLSGWTSPVPVGNADRPFNGIFDGAGYTIRNLTMRAGRTGLFGEVGSSGKVKRLGLENANITLTSQAGQDQIGGVLAGVVQKGGVLQNCYVRGSFTVESLADTSKTVRAGVLAGRNLGAITGCYFRPNMEQTKANNQVVASDYIGVVMTTPRTLPQKQFQAGILVGYNSGKISGCYHTSNLTANEGAVSRVMSIAGCNAGTIMNTFYDTFGSNMSYAWDVADPDGNTLSNTEEYRRNTAGNANTFKTQEIAQELSFDLYLGTYVKDNENDGYPKLYAFDLVKKRFPAFSLESSILLNLQNKGADTDASTVMTAVCSYETFLFPIFGKIPVLQSLKANLPSLPKGVGYKVSEATAYGYVSEENSTKTSMKPNISSDGTTIDLTSNLPYNTYQINITIKLTGGTESELPWGVRVQWNSSQQISGDGTGAN